VAKYDENKSTELIQDRSFIRNKQKIATGVNNAK